MIDDQRRRELRELGHWDRNGQWVSARRSAAVAWWAFCRGVGYNFARLLFRAFK